MVDSRLSSKEFVQRVFSPSVAVFCSPGADIVCQKNGLSFVELIRPFCSLEKEVNFHDPSGAIITVKQFQVYVHEMNSVPPDPAAARSFLNQSVSRNYDEKFSVIHTSVADVEVPVTAVWYEKWRDVFLRVQSPADHEFIRHYVACIIVTSTTDEDPIDVLSNMGQQLQQMLGVIPVKNMPRWFSSSVLRYYVLIHDVSAVNILKAESTYEEMKLTYSSQCCHLLPINSRTPDTTTGPPVFDYWTEFDEKYECTDSDVIDESEDSVSSPEAIDLPLCVVVTQSENSKMITHPLSHPIAVNNISQNIVDGDVKAELPKVLRGRYLSEDDLNRIKNLVSSFVTDALLPYVETQMQYLNEMVSNRKGVSKSLFTATKRWFTPSKTGSSALNMTNSYMYSEDCAEMQMRRLADLCFMFRAYTYAFQMYHMAKRDFSGDGAWLHYAGALEMASLSAFMLGLDMKRALEYAEESITTYLHMCRMPQFTTRVTLCVLELLKDVNLHGEAAKLLIQMTSEDSDLRSALLLEQASYCFVTSKKPCMPRKYAFHLVLAGHRYSKAGQKRHSLRCYRQALRVYEGKGWNLAEDHIHFTIGRLASNLKDTEIPVEEFSKLFSHPGRQLPIQQSVFLKEYILALMELRNSRSSEETKDSAPNLVIPRIDHSSIKVILDATSATSVDVPASYVAASGLDVNADSNWHELEQKLVTCVYGQSPLFRPTNNVLTNFTNNGTKRTIITGESISIGVDLVNQLNIPITLQHLRLTWQYSNLTQDPSLAFTSCIPSLVLESDFSAQVVLSITPNVVGKLHVTGIAYSIALTSSLDMTDNVALSITGYQELKPQAGRTFVGKHQKKHAHSEHVQDRRLQFSVIDSAPCLKVYFEDVPTELLCGEIHKTTLHLYNAGSLPVTRILFTCSDLHLISIPSLSAFDTCYQLPLRTPLNPGDITHHTLYIRGDDNIGQYSADMLFYYDSEEFSSQKKLKYRLVYHTFQLFIRQSIVINAMAIRSISADHKDEETVNIRITVCNRCCEEGSNVAVPPSKLILCQFSLFSEKWQLMDILSPRDEGVTVLESSGSSSFVLKACARKSSIAHNVSSLYLTSAEDPAQCDKSYYDFMQSKASYVFGTSQQEQIAEVDESFTDSVRSVNILLVVSWKAEIERQSIKHEVKGQHHVPIRLLNEKYSSEKQQSLSQGLESQDLTPPIGEPAPPLPSHVSISQESVLVAFSNPHFVSHQFSLSRVCYVPIHLILQNCSSIDLQIKIDTSQTSSPNILSSSGIPQSGVISSNFLWSGITQKYVELKAHKTSVFNLTACFSCVGTYDLASRLIISSRCASSEECFITQSSKPFSLIFISDNNR